MRRRTPRPKREPTIALINIVFLMLVFFLVAGTIALPLDRDVTLVNTADLEGRPPPDALVVHPDGSLRYQGMVIADAAAYLSRLDEAARAEIRVVPDRQLAAVRLIDLGRALQAAGAEKVMIVTERALQ